MKNSVLLFLLLPLQLLAQTTLIKDVSIVDVEKRRIVPDQSVLIVNERIERIAPFKKFKKIAADTIIDGTGQYLMPGMMDTHIHFFQSGGLYTRPDALDLRKLVPYEEEIQFAKDNAIDNLRRYLRNGITTVMDVGGPFWNFTVRDSVAQTFNGPEVLVTGPLFSMVARPQMELGDPPIIKITNKEEILQLFNRQLARRPDFIKVWYIVNEANPAENSFPLVQYLGELCQQHNLKLAVHATQLETARLAVEAGANILVHSVDDDIIPADFIEQLKEKKVTYIPTLTVREGYLKSYTGDMVHRQHDLQMANPFAYNSLSHPQKIDTALWPPVLKRLYGQKIALFGNSVDSIMALNLKKVNEAGVNVATGTDAGNIGTMHASSFYYELLAMQKAGLSSWDLLASSTINAARGFGLEEDFGSVVEGKMADLLLLRGNPIEDIANVNNIAAVVKSGEVVDVDQILQETPGQIVQRQVNAYNARDLEAFLSTYSEDVKIFNSDGKMTMEGHEAMRKVYDPIFESVTDLYCDITNRIAINNKVIDNEKVRFRGQYVDAVAMYTVEDGKIVRVDFIK